MAASVDRTLYATMRWLLLMRCGQMNSGSAIVIHRESPPALVNLSYWFQKARYRKLASVPFFRAAETCAAVTDDLPLHARSVGVPRQSGRDTVNQALGVLCPYQDRHDFRIPIDHRPSGNGNRDQRACPRVP